MELRVNVFEMKTDSVEADGELMGDFSGDEPACQQAGNSLLSRRQLPGFFRRDRDILDKTDDREWAGVLSREYMT
jgi:hypothetical protein